MWGENTVMSLQIHFNATVVCKRDCVLSICKHVADLSIGGETSFQSVTIAITNISCAGHLS